MNRIVAVVLAGGEARRMGGGDKPLLALGGRTILDLLLERLRPQVADVALSANGDPARFARFSLPVLPDGQCGIGPLAGLAAALRWAAGTGAEAVLTVPGDTPFIPADLAERLWPAPAVALSQGRRHHLVATWPTAWAGAPERYLAGLPSGAPNRARGALAFAATVATMREVAFADAAGGDPFLNVNTPADHREAEGRAAGDPR